jgi:NAD(P)-dependent dehydrogenase (short-subunit alcohol dehydrogenase family)
MSEKKVWFITGAGRGMGVDIARAALAAGNAVVATGRNTDAVAKAVGAAGDLLVVKLDVTSSVDAEAAVQAAPNASATSTCSSTTPATFMRATSRS